MKSTIINIKKYYISVTDNRNRALIFEANKGEAASIMNNFDHLKVCDFKAKVYKISFEIDNLNRELKIEFKINNIHIDSEPLRWFVSDDETPLNIDSPDDIEDIKLTAGIQTPFGDIPLDEICSGNEQDEEDRHSKFNTREPQIAIIIAKGIEYYRI